MASPIPPVLPGMLYYPAQEATHEQVLADRDLFHGALQRLLSHLGIKLKMPKVGGAEVDLHLLYKEVTNMGGLEVVTQRKQWVLVCEPFNFPASFTNRSFVMKKLYVNALHHFEQVYFHNRGGLVITAPLVTSSAAAAAAAAVAAAAAAVAAAAPAPPSPKRRRLCKSDSAMLVEPVVVVPDGPSSNSGSTSSAFKGLEAGVQFTGVIDGTVPDGFRITLQLPGQCLQGVLYRQAPPELLPVTLGGGQPSAKAAGAAAAGGTHTDEDTAVSQELESRHQLQSSGAPTAAPPAPPPPPTMPLHPRPARTPYQFFQLGVNKEQLLQLHPGLSSARRNELLPKLMSELWHQMTPEQHKPFYNMALRDKARYDREWEAYNRWLSESGATGDAHEAQGEVRTPPATPNPGYSMIRTASGAVLDMMPLPPGPPPALGLPPPHHPLHHPHLPPHLPPHMMPQPGPSHAPSPKAGQRRVCLGIPVSSPHRPYTPMPHTMVHPIKVRMGPPHGHGIYSPSHGHRYAPPPHGPPPMGAMGPDLGLLPPDMEPEDLDHLCHYPQDEKPVFGAGFRHSAGGSGAHGHGAGQSHGGGQGHGPQGAVLGEHLSYDPHAGPFGSPHPSHGQPLSSGQMGMMGHENPSSNGGGGGGGGLPPTGLMRLGSGAVPEGHHDGDAFTMAFDTLHGGPGPSGANALRGAGGSGNGDPRHGNGGVGYAGAAVVAAAAAAAANMFSCETPDKDASAMVSTGAGQGASCAAAAAAAGGGPTGLGAMAPPQHVPLHRSHVHAARRM